MRTKAYQLKKQLLNQDDKPIITSCTIPNWQLHRIQKIKTELIANLKTAKINKRIVEGQIELIALKLFMKKMSPRQGSPKRAIQYNADHNNYVKINLNIKNENDYFLFHSKRAHIRVSVSFLMDLALRLYLRMAARLLFLQLTKANIKKKWLNILDNFSIYKENIQKDTQTDFVSTIYLKMRWNSS